MLQTVDINPMRRPSVPQRNPSSELGKDDFLKLLTTQLQNQDPTNPMEDMSFIGEMAQFTSLEQMLNIKKSIDGIATALNGNSTTQAMLYLGTTVTVKTDKGPVTGVVEMVGFDKGTPYLKVGENAYTLDEVELVSPTIAKK